MSNDSNPEVVSVYETMILRVRGSFTMGELYQRLRVLDYPTRHLAVRVTKVDEDLFQLDIRHYKALVGLEGLKPEEESNK